MRARRIPALLLLTVLLAACGGSGSSGFDVAPGRFEATLIERAIAENRCVAGEDGLSICASGVPVPDPGGGTPSPGSRELRVDASFAGEIDCAASGCMVAVGVAVDGLPQGAEVRLAVRAIADDVWRVGEPVVAPAAGGDLPTPVGGEIDGETAPGDELQVAVLVFLPPLGEVPAAVRALHETGARYAFVIAPVALTPGVAS